MARAPDADRRHADAYRLTERPAPAPADPGEASPPRVVDNAAQAARAARARGAAPIVREPKQFAAVPGPLAPPPTAGGVPPPPAPPPFDDE